MAKSKNTPVPSGRGRKYQGHLLHELWEPITIRISPEATKLALATQEAEKIAKNQGAYGLTCGIATRGEAYGFFALYVQSMFAEFLIPHPETGKIIAVRAKLDKAAREYVDLFDARKIDADRWYTVSLIPPPRTEQLEYKTEHDVSKADRPKRTDVNPIRSAAAKKVKRRKTIISRTTRLGTASMRKEIDGGVVAA